MRIKIAVTGRNYLIAHQLPREIILADGAGSAEVLQRLNEHLPVASPLPGSCLLAVNGEHLGTVLQHAPRRLQDGDELVLIVPVAGG